MTICLSVCLLKCTDHRDCLFGTEFAAVGKMEDFCIAKNVYVKVDPNIPKYCKTEF